jgi:Holliday junction resolvase RusA-like endonuclease
MNIKYILPFPVSVNYLYAGGSGQKRFKSKKYKLWLAACEAFDYDPAEYDGVFITYKFWFPDNRERDSANLEKCVTDWLVTKRIIKNDAWQNIKAMRLIPMGIDKINPRVEIEITTQAE